MARRYPLTTIAQLRDKQVASAAVTREAEQAKRDAKKNERTHAENATRTHLDSVAQVNALESSLLSEGQLRAADLVRHGAWSHMASRTTDRLQAAQDARHAEERRAEEALKNASEELVHREREAQILNKHQERFETTETKRAENAEADEIEDQWRRR